MPFPQDLFPFDEDDLVSDFDGVPWDELEPAWPEVQGEEEPMTASTPPTPEPATRSGATHVAALWPVRRTATAPIGRSRQGRPVDPRTAQGEHAQRLLRIVRAFGAVSAGVAAKVASHHWGHHPTATYRASQACGRAGYLARLPVKSLGVKRAADVGLILVPGPRWGEWEGHAKLEGIAEALGGRSGAPPLTEDSLPSRIVEQLVLSAEILRRVLAGWDVRRGDAWLIAVSELERPRASSGLEWARASARRSGTLRFPDDGTPLGLIPPDGKTEEPALFVGGVYAPWSRFAGHARAAQILAPVEVVCARRTRNSVERIRQIAAKRLRGGGSRVVTVLPTSPGRKWQRFWTDVQTSLDVTPNNTTRERLVRWLGAP